jgi:thiol-disulfide isomerase/thioredoxin
MNALKERAQAVLNDKSIDEQSRTIIRDALERNDPWLAEMVRRADAGETIEDMHRPQSASSCIRRFTAKLALLVLAALPGFTPCFAQAADTLDLNRFRGKVVLLDFWASWCEPCRQSFPWLNAMQAKYADRGLVIIGVNVDRVRTDADRFLRDVPADFKIVYDSDGSLAAHYEVPGMPSSYVFGPTGELVGQHIGFRNATREEREAELQNLLSSAGPTGRTQ